MDLLRSELKDYSKEDFYDSLCYLADKTSKTRKVNINGVCSTKQCY